MKFKTTAKAIKNCYSKILQVGYCELASLLRYREPVAYACGVYGWNFDLYDVKGVAICTGYRGMPASTLSDCFDIRSKYERKAREIGDNWAMPYEEKKEKTEKLLREMVNEIIEETAKNRWGAKI